MRRRFAVLVALVAVFMLPASSALAFHCMVANKPAGAGTMAESDLGTKQTGNGKNIVTGAFIRFEGEANDYFVRGPQYKFVNEYINTVGSSVGMLPDQPMDRGSEDNGVVWGH